MIIIKIQKKLVPYRIIKFTLNIISNLMKKEKSVFVYQKLNYLLLRKIGFSNKEASEFMNVTSVTGNNWHNAWKNNGYEGLLRKKGQGRKCKLTEEQLEELKKTRRKR